MRRILLFSLVITVIVVTIGACGKITSEPSCSDCDNCEYINWKDKSSFIFVDVDRGTAGSPYTVTYKSTSTTQTVDNAVFYETIISKKTGSTAPIDSVRILHACDKDSNRFARVLYGSSPATGFKVLRLLPVYNFRVNDSWVDELDGDTVVKRTITGVNATGVTVFGKTYPLNMVVNEKTYTTGGNLTDTTLWSLVKISDNYYAKERVSSTEIRNIGLVQQIVFNPSDLVRPAHMTLLKAYSIP